MPKTPPEPQFTPTAAAFGSRRLLDVAETAALTGLPPRTVRRLFDERRVPLVKIGRRLFVWSDDLAAYLDASLTPAKLGGAR